MRKNLLCKLSNLIVLSTLIFTIGCKRTEIPVTPDPTPTNPIGGVVNDATQVTASVSGIVLDETNAPIANAVVTSGTATTTTNTNGMFIFQNISLSKENGNVTVVKAGYFKGIRSFKTTEGKNHTVRIQLMQRTLSGTVNAAAGGTITSNGGATIIFSANAFVTSTGAAYTGTVSVYSRWIDPTAANLPFVIPGDLRGVSTTGVENILETYGMVGAELADASGNVLKIATGETATVSFPIPTSLSATAPASIVLWHFDEATARWKENGTATKTGSTYTAQVDKFSFWNVDVPNTNFVNLDYTFINATTNSPLVSTSTRIKRVSNGTYGYGITNNVGFVSGLVPKNEALVLEVVASSGCGTIFYSQNIGPFASNTSLGNINVTIPVSQYLTFTGTLVNCSATAVSNGFVSILVNALGGAFVAPNASGVFSATILNCSGTNNATYNYQGTDYTTSQQSAVIQGSTTTNTVNIGNVTACGAVQGVNVYVAGYTSNLGATLWKNGVPIALTTNPDSSFANSVYVLGTDVYVAGGNGRKAIVWKNGVATNLTNGITSVEAFSVFVSGTDVYVAGTEYSNNSAGSIAKVWKNGIVTNLTNGTNRANANSVFVVGSDVYVAGSEYAATVGGQIGKVWKNGVATTNLLNGIFNTEAVSIFVAGNDVHVAGYFNDTLNGGPANITKPVQWKNGIATNLSTGSIYGGAYSVFVLGADVYFAGAIDGSQNNEVARVWKNGVGTNLANPNNVTNTYANSIFAFSSDIYVAGSSYDSNGNQEYPILWKNGLPVLLTIGNNTGIANSVFVK
jgi:hypothetical protein